ncbi:MAG: 2,3-bisphosphoglycerate-independent phosphoglycerate mutase [Planctomycetota bacterium]|jgi:2,3-bisphosphoglycerate-independent phosphoglycerate mutase
MSQPVALIILDGWGLSDRPEDDATAQADISVVPRLLAEYPSSTLEASGLAVGLPEGVIGNSEVGHLNLGAGRKVYQSLTRIDQSIEDRSFFANEALRFLAQRTQQRGQRLHLIGLLSTAGVHASLRHTIALLELAAEVGLKDSEVLVHPITDGRDTAPESGAAMLRELQSAMDTFDVGAFGSLTGRYYTMDRDKRWERTQRGFNAIVHMDAPRVEDAIGALEASYEQGVTDEFFEPVCLNSGAPIRDGDGVILWNFRADRMRQFTAALTDPLFEGFEADEPAPEVHAVSMTGYGGELEELPVAFAPQRLDKVLGDVVASAGRRQLRVAETEKYAHVTYFFNGGREQPFPQEDRILVPSPQDVATYDLKPSMSANEVTDATIARFQGAETRPDLLVLNYANPDMVGHTGSMEAAIEAVETVDACLGRLLEAIRSASGVALVTADHGNCEVMRDPETGDPHTAHTLNRVPLVLVDDARRERGVTLREGALADIAPTLLELLGIEQPEAMTGRSLLLEP